MAAVLKYWTGSAWVAKPLKYWTGSAWTTKQLKYWNGSAWIGGAAPGSPPFLDTFNRADANLEASPTASGGWTWTHDGLIAGGLSIVSNQLRSNTVDPAGSIYKTADLGTVEQYVQYKVLTPTVSLGNMVSCRVTDNNNHVGLAHGSSLIRVYRRVSGILTQIISVAVAANDIVRLECNGANATLKKNGAVVGTVPIGATFTSTFAGILARGVNAVLFEDFEAGVFTSFTDTFDRANANLEASATASGGWSWTHDGAVAGALTINTNQLNCGTTNTTGSAYKTPALASVDHYVQFKTTSVSIATGSFICCRLQDNNNFVGFRAGNGGSNGQIEVYRRVSGTLSSLYASAASAFIVGDILRMDCTGTNFTIRKNGVIVTGPTAIGGTFTSTNAGIVARTTTGVFCEDFEAGL